MIADVLRAYVPSCDYKWQGFQQQNLAAVAAMPGYPNILLPILVPGSLIHRKVWAWFYSISGTWSADIDLVASLNNREVFRQKIVNWNTSAVAQKWLFCFAQMTSSVGALNEMMLVQIAGSTNFGSCAHRLNISADKIYFAVNSLTGGAALFDAGLHVQSQAGI